MFEVGFAELLVLGVIALLVVGPDRIPGLARTVGIWVGKAQRLVGQVRADIEREVRADELRKAAKEYSPTAALADVRKEVEDLASEVSRPVDLDTDDAKPNAGAAPATGQTGAGAAEPEAPAASPEAAGRPVGAGEAGAESVEPAAGDTTGPEAPAAEASGGTAGGAPAAGPEAAGAPALDETGVGRADPSAAAPEGVGTRENGRPASPPPVPGESPAEPAEGAALSDGRTNGAAPPPPAVTGGTGAPRIERDERTAAP